MKIKLSKVTTDKSKMTRRFSFPATGKPDDRFTVAVNYLSPALFNEKTEEIRVRHTEGAGRRGPSMTQEEQRRAMAKDILVKVVGTIGGDRAEDKVTLRKLSRLITLDPKVIAENGGLDSEVDLNDQENLVHFIVECGEFYAWLLDTCTDLTQFQDEEWEKQLRNLGSGQASSSEQQ